MDPGRRLTSGVSPDICLLAPRTRSWHRQHWDWRNLARYRSLSEQRRWLCLQPGDGREGYGPEGYLSISLSQRAAKVGYQ